MRSVCALNLSSNLAWFLIIVLIYQFPLHSCLSRDDLDPSKSFPRCPGLNISDDPTDIKFYYFGDYKKLDEYQEFLLYDRDSILSSGFNPEEKTVLLVHGYFNNLSSPMPVTIKNAYLEAGLPHNVIVVDWGRLSTPEEFRPGCHTTSYLTVVRRSIPIVAKRLAEFIQFLLDDGFTSLAKLHLIGFSLGAHASGWAGSLIADNEKNGKNRKIGRITGLDPAGPGFQFTQLRRRLNAEDAKLVDVYHTATSMAGNAVRGLGHADFFPNGGRRQPGCPSSSWESCSHAFAYYLYAASIHQNMYQMEACLCDPEYNYLGNACPGNCSIVVPAGEPCPPYAKGQFYFKTEAIPHLAAAVAMKKS